jgi:glucose/mannose transport system permease protein
LNKRQILRVLLYVTLIVIAALFAVPLVVMMITSIKSPAEVVNTFALPKGIHVENYTKAFEVIGRGLLNSLFMTVPAVLISAFVGSLGAYPLSQFRFKGDYAIYMFLLAGLFIPTQIVIIPLFQIMRTLKLYDTYMGMWLVHTVYGIPICTFYLRNFFATIPHSLLEASLIDGCSIAGYYFRILLPLAKPGFAAVIILQARSIWNDLLFGLTLTRSEYVRPVTVELATFVGQTDVQYGQLMASTLLSILPTIIVFLIFRKQFISGVLGGAVKG